MALQRADPRINGLALAFAQLLMSICRLFGVLFAEQTHVVADDHINAPAMTPEIALRASGFENTNVMIIVYTTTKISPRTT